MAHVLDSNYLLIPFIKHEKRKWEGGINNFCVCYRKRVLSSSNRVYLVQEVEALRHGSTICDASNRFANI